jgi:ubiquinone biosynthesis protein
VWEPALRRGLIDLARFGLDLPGTLRRLTRQLDRGEFTVSVRPQGLDEPLRRLEVLVNRLAMSVLLAAFIVSAALLMRTYHPRDEGGLPGWFSTAGLITATVLGVWLLLSIWRSGRR